MKVFITSILSVFLYSFSFGQTVKELYDNKNYKELVKLENKVEELTADELYMLGFSFFQLANDNKAIAYYDKAIAKGLDNGLVYFQKGVSYSYMKRYDESIAQLDIALEKEPTSQRYMNQKGQVYRYQGKEQLALKYFLEATKFPRASGEPFFWIAYIYHGKQEFKTALALYYTAKDSVHPDNGYYIEVFKSIGKLEFSFTKDYLKAAKAYTKVIELDPKGYDIYPKLIKAYNSAKEFEKADSVFDLMKVAYNKNELPKDDMKFKNIAIDESDWNGQTLKVYKYLVDTEKSLDIAYKVYLLTKDGSKIERKFMVEQTLEIPDGPKYLLCEKNRKTGSHITYPYGWKAGAITLEDLKRVVTVVLDGKMKQSASSNFSK